MKYNIWAELIPVENKFKEETIECGDRITAYEAAKTLAWDLYTENAGMLIVLPTFEQFKADHRKLWIELSEDEFEQTITDLFIKHVYDNVDFGVDEDIDCE